MKIFTYYEDINFKEQDGMIQLWKQSWENNGFEAIVLSEKDAISHPYYNTFVTGLKDIHKNIAGKDIRPYGLSCYVRWLAYASLNIEESFLVSDYDVINVEFKSKDLLEPTDKLSFLDGRCPCLAYGNSKLFLKFCEYIINTSILNTDEIIKTYQEKKFGNYHDQEFLCLNLNQVDFYNICSPRKYVKLYQYDDINFNSHKLFHVAHKSVGDAKEKNPDFKNTPGDILRLQFIKSLLTR